MTKEYKNIIGDISAYTAELRKLIPDTMNGFTTMAKAATQTKVLDEKNKRADRFGFRRRRTLRRVPGLSHAHAGQAGRYARRDCRNLGHGHLYGGRAVADVCGRCHARL